MPRMTEADKARVRQLSAANAKVAKARRAGAFNVNPQPNKRKRKSWWNGTLAVAKPSRAEAAE